MRSKDESCEMRIVWYICGRSRRDRIRNEAIHEKVGVTLVADKMCEARLR